MATLEGSQARKVGLSFDKLSETASTLNSATRRLNEAIDQLNASLKQLNLGIPVWHQTWVHEDHNLTDVEEIGYARVRGKWGISIRKTIQLVNGPEEPDESEWPFADAPRDLRIRAIEFLPRLMDKLSDEAAAAAEKLSERANEAEGLASVISAIAAEKSLKRVKLLPERERGK
jgi:hypothetical protein